MAAMYESKHARIAPIASDIELENGVPVFLSQLGDALRRAKSTEAVDHTEIGMTAGRHGQDLLRMGLTIGQVVHDYGDVCQTITALALETGTPIAGEDFKTLNLCLDDAIAEAVTGYARMRERATAEHGTERLGILAHELRGALNTAMLSFESMKSGRVGLGAATGIVLEQSLLKLRGLVDRSLADVRLDVGLGRLEPLSVKELVEAVEIGALVRATARAIQFVSAPIDRDVIVAGDRETLSAAVSNLIDNAFKFTRARGTVSLTVRAGPERVLIEVEDECGGLPPGKTEDLFRAFEQRGSDRSGLGLGLAICARAASANGGEVRVKDLPGKGCVFTLDLPKSSLPPSAV
jgi:signal transduction histidine kinase